MYLKRGIALLLSVFLLLVSMPTALADEGQGLPETPSGLSDTAPEPPLQPTPEPTPEPAPEPTPEPLQPADAPAEQPPVEQAPTMRAEIITDGSEPGLYMTIDGLPADVRTVITSYSFNGTDYYRAWEPDELVITDNRLRLLLCGPQEHPLYGYLAGTVENLYIQASYYIGDDLFNDIVLEPFHFSHGKSYETPASPPDFNLRMKFEDGRHALYGEFTDFPPNVDFVSLSYSWDGEQYESFSSRWFLQNMGHPDPEQRKMSETTHLCMDITDPLESFLAKEKDRFFVRLTIHTLDGEEYDSKPASLSREGSVPLPEHLTPRIMLGFDIDKVDISYEPEFSRISYGVYQLTAKENATAAEVMAMLPDTVPVNITLWDNETKERFTYAELDCEVQWKPIKALNLTAGKPVTIEDAAEALVIPAGTEVETPLGTYTLPKPLSFKSRYDSDQIRLIINPVAADAAPQIVLRGCDLELLEAAMTQGDSWYKQPEGEDTAYIDFYTPLRILLLQKPSGATSVEAYTVVGDERIPLNNLSSIRPIDYNQSRAEYGCTPDPNIEDRDSHYYRYLNGELDSFRVEVAITGGVFDGQTLSAVWPGQYTLPPVLPEKAKGSAGSENNAGTAFEEIDEDSDGQRPWLPPADNSNNNSNNGNSSSTDSSSEPTETPASASEPPALPAMALPESAPAPAPSSAPATTYELAASSEPELPAAPAAPVAADPLPVEEAEPQRAAPAKSGAIPTPVKAAAAVSVAAAVPLGYLAVGGADGAGKLAALLAKLRHLIIK